MNKLFLAALSVLLLMTTQAVYSSDGKEDAAAAAAAVTAATPMPDFPDEVIVEILSHADVKTAFNAHAVSKQWQRCAQTVLGDYLRARPIILNVNPKRVQGWQDDGTLIANFKTLYAARARTIFHNWKKKQKRGVPTLPDQPTLQQIDRLNCLPKTPPKGLDDFNQKEHLGLALDKYRLPHTFYLQSYLYYFPGLIEKSKTLKTLNFTDKSPDFPFREIFAALGTSSVTEITFDHSNLSPENIEFLCNSTLSSWRNSVKKIKISTSPTKRLSAMLSALLRAFPNLEIFESLQSFDLTGSLVVFQDMPNLTNLRLSFDDANALLLKDLALALKEGKLPAFETLRVWDTDALGNDALPDVLWIIENHPKVELNIFNDTGFSEGGLRQVVDALAKQSYPWKMFTGLEPDCVKAYNSEYFASRDR